jgi:hypothetical protein
MEAAAQEHDALLGILPAPMTAIDKGDLAAEAIFTTISPSPYGTVIGSGSPAGLTADSESFYALLQTCPVPEDFAQAGSR